MRGKLKPGSSAEPPGRAESLTPLRCAGKTLGALKLGCGRMLRMHDLKAALMHDCMVPVCQANLQYVFLFRVAKLMSLV